MNEEMKATMKSNKNSKPESRRNIVSITIVLLLVAAAIGLAPLVLAKPRAELNKDISICTDKQVVVYDSCLDHGGSEDQCWKHSEVRYNQCMRQRGNAPGTYPPLRPKPIGTSPTNPPTKVGAPPPTPAPVKTRPIITASVAPVKGGSGTSPTPTQIQSRSKRHKP